jgi:hypothetical protein
MARRVNLDVHTIPCIMPALVEDSMNIKRGLFRLWPVVSSLSGRQKAS